MIFDRLMYIDRRTRNNELKLIGISRNLYVQANPDPNPNPNPNPDPDPNPTSANKNTITHGCVITCSSSSRNLINTMNFHQNHRFREIPMDFNFLVRDHRSMYINRSKIMNSSSIFFMLTKETT